MMFPFSDFMYDDVLGITNLDDPLLLIQYKVIIYYWCNIIIISKMNKYNNDM